VTQLLNPSSTASAQIQLALVSKRLVGLTARRTGFCIGLFGNAGIGKTHTALQLLQASPCRFQVTQSTVGIQALTNTLRGSKKLATVIERNVQRIQNGERLELQTLIDVYAAMLSAQAPFVLLVEDMHEASAEQLEFWNALCKLVTRLSGVAIIQTSRVSFTDPVENIALEPLTPKQSKSSLEEHLNAKLPVAALDWVYSRCAGNPLFTLEFADFLTRHDALWNDGKTWKWREPLENTLPNTVEAIIRQWLSDLTLSAETRVVLEARAYFETRAPGQVLDDLIWATICQLPLETLQLARQQLETFKVLQNNVFAHPLYREVTDQSLKSVDRKTMSLRMLQCFTAEKSQLILCFLDDAQLERNAALTLLEEAAKQAEAVGNKSNVGWLLARATEFAEGEYKGVLAFQAAQALEWVDVHKAVELAEIAASLQPENTEALFHLAELLVGQGRNTESEAVILRLPEAMKHGLAWAERLVLWYRHADDNSLVLNLLRHYPELEFSQNLGVLSSVVQFLIGMREHDWAVRFAKVALHLDQTNLSVQQQIKVLDIQSLIAELDRDFAQYDVFQSKVIDLALEHQLPIHACQGLYRRGSIRQLINQDQLALGDLEAASKIAEEIGHLRAYHSNQLVIGKISSLLGAFESAEKKLLSAKAYFEKTSTDLCVLSCEALTDLYELWSEPRKKILITHYAQEAIRYFNIAQTPEYMSNILRLQAILTFSLGQLEQCLEFTNQLREIGQFSALRGKALIALQCSNEAIQAFQEAIQATREENCTREEQVIGLELDNLTRNTASAQERLEWFQSRGLQAYVKLAQRYFPEFLETNPKTLTTNLENLGTLEVLGQIRMRTDGKTEVVRGQKRQELLALLLHARMEGQSEIQVDDLRETLYPYQGLKEGSNALRQTIHKTRSSYGQNVIVTTSNGYALGNVTSDAESFLNDGNTSLWRNPYLNGLQLDSMDSIQENLNLRLHLRATDLLETNPSETTRLADILLASNPYDLEALRLKCLGLRQLSQHAALKRTYQKARVLFLEIGEHLPETWAKFLNA
jgi:AAA domain